MLLVWTSLVPPPGLISNRRFAIPRGSRTTVVS
jgi:hypothetical protein